MTRVSDETMMDNLYRRVRVACEVVLACGGIIREMPEGTWGITIPKLSSAERAQGAWRWYVSIGDVGCYSTPRSALKWDVWNIAYDDDKTTWTIDEHTGNLYRMPGVKYVVKKEFRKPRMFGIDGREITL